jgi:hypothetical protein
MINGYIFQIKINWDSKAQDEISNLSHLPTFVFLRFHALSVGFFIMLNCKKTTWMRFPESTQNEIPRVLKNHMTHLILTQSGVALPVY